MLDLAAHRVYWRGLALPLTEHEFQMLAALMEPPGRACTYDELRKRVWGTEYGDASLVRTAVKRLRRKLPRAGVTVRIEPVHGVGFRLGI